MTMTHENPMIHIVCRTNLDLASERWPDRIPAVPRVGDRIASATKWGDFQLELEVVEVMWRPIYSPETRKAEWMPYIELHMTSWQRSLPSRSSAERGSIRAFFEWYAPLVGRSVGSFI